MHFMAMKEHMPNKADTCTAHLQSRMQNVCFLRWLSPVIFKLMVQITSIFCKRYFCLQNLLLKAFLDPLNGR